MTLWQTSQTCQIWVLLCEVYKDSNLHRLLAAAGRWCSEQIETSRILRPLCREGAAARAWESSLPCRALTALVNLPVWYSIWGIAPLLLSSGVLRRCGVSHTSAGTMPTAS